MQDNIIITGASSGIGLQIVRDLLESGRSVSACIRRTSDDLKHLKDIHKKLYIYNFDLDERDSIKKAALEIFSNKDQKIYGLVNCAGLAHGALFAMTPIEEMERIFRINYFNQLYFTQLISKKLVRNKSGSIINIASTSGIFGDEGTIAYGGSKAALIHSTKVLATELGKYNIRVNSISPALVETQMSEQMDQKSKDKLNSRKSLEGVILPKDISSLAKFLLSEESQKISGQNFRVDQGMFA